MAILNRPGASLISGHEASCVLAPALRERAPKANPCADARPLPRHQISTAFIGTFKARISGSGGGSDGNTSGPTRPPKAGDRNRAEMGILQP